MNIYLVRGWTQTAGTAFEWTAGAWLDQEKAEQQARDAKVFSISAKIGDRNPHDAVLPITANVGERRYYTVERQTILDAPVDKSAH